ncbi:MAG: Lacal_2735 family protein [Flavobacteriales bacterium]|tara:strand:+ start:187 stop:369 length:183 start_codon:yes stop_codon:yes gene_type:complete
MFGLFKKKTEREKLLEIYKKKKEEAFNLSKINRTKSDKLEQEAYEISKKIDLLDKEQNNA